MKRTEFIKKVFTDTLPVLAGYFVLGIGFGMLLKAHGYGWLFSAYMCVGIYAGSMQFVMIEMLSEGVGLVSAALTAFLVNCRHLFYSITMVDRYRDTGRAKPYLIYALTDETFSLVSTEDSVPPEQRRQYYLAVSVINQLYWVGSCVLGSLLGSALKFNTEGIDFALTALFVCIFTEQWLSGKEHISAQLGLGLSLLCLLIFGAESFLIPSMITIVAAMAIVRGKERAA